MLFYSVRYNLLKGLMSDEERICWTDGLGGHWNAEKALRMTFEPIPISFSVHDRSTTLCLREMKLSNVVTKLFLYRVMEWEQILWNLHKNLGSIQQRNPMLLNMQLPKSSFGIWKTEMHWFATEYRKSYMVAVLGTSFQDMYSKVLIKDQKPCAHCKYCCLIYSNDTLLHIVFFILRPKLAQKTWCMVRKLMMASTDISMLSYIKVRGQKLIVS